MKDSHAPIAYERLEALAAVELMAMPVVSTAHLSEEEGRRASEEWPSTCYSNEYGFIAHFGTVEDVRDSIEAQDETPEEWPGFLAAAAWAQALGYSWVRFDCDGEIQPGLSTWDW